MISMFKIHPLMKIVNGSVIKLPAPLNISYFWNFGSLLGICLGVQIMTGIFLAIHYTSDISTAFLSVNHILRDVNGGWMIRIIHSNGASFFFICLYFHAARGIYYQSYKMQETWLLGVIILLMVMAAAFLGYVLPWGQMSFWGATVITNLFSVIPFVGNEVVVWLWGGFSVDGATLSRFFAFHYLVPFLVAFLVILHLLFLHQSGSSNPLGTSGEYFKISFHPYYSFKDLLGVMVMLMGLFFISIYYPWMFADPENFIPANSLVTPAHIQPEWYFLFAYAILRSIPNKLGGVIALAGSVLILMTLTFTSPLNSVPSMFNPVFKFFFWSLVVTVILLTWIGASPVESWYVTIGQILTIYYFMFFLLVGYVHKLWVMMLK